MQGLGQDQSNTGKTNPKRKYGTTLTGETTTKVATTPATNSSSGSNSVSLAANAIPKVPMVNLIETMNRELDSSNAYPVTKRLKRFPLDDEEEEDFDPELYSNLEERLVFKDIQNAYDDLKDFDRIFYLLKLYKIQELTRITQENDQRLKNNPFATPILSETDPKLKKVEILFKIVCELTKKKIDHLNNYLYCNIMFANHYQCPYYLKTEEATEDMRHRISNFLSRCNKKKYGHDRISSWLNDLIHDFIYIRAGLIKKSDDNIVIN